MTPRLHQLWRDEAGSVSVELALMAAVLAVGTMGRHSWAGRRMSSAGHDCGGAIRPRGSESGCRHVELPSSTDMSLRASYPVHEIK